MAEPGGLPSMGLHRVGHDLSDLAAPAAAVTIFRAYRAMKLKSVTVSIISAYISHEVIGPNAMILVF